MYLSPDKYFSDILTPFQKSSLDFSTGFKAVKQQLILIKKNSKNAKYNRKMRI